jgi:CubicO group peptidase (beta-lactamase class C family)
LQCVERGHLALEEPLARVVPDFPEPSSTLRDVLSHTAVPDRVFAFDPTRYDLVAGAIKACSGGTLRGTLTREILDRLAMTDSVPGHDFASWSASTLAQFDRDVVERYERVMSRLATPYRRDGRTRARFEPTSGLTAATGLVSTAHDLARFQAALDSGILLEPETVRDAWTAPSLSDGWPSRHALGWFVQRYEGRLVAWQFGVIPNAYSSLLLTLPERGVTLILLANHDGLVAKFPLADGDISVSPFARLFLRLFS